MKRLWRLVFLPLAAFIVSAAPAPTVVPHPSVDDEALFVPADSPVQFERFDKNGVAHFRGSFVVSGTFTYGCTIDCEERPSDRFYRMDFTPDPNMADRLPHWRIRGRVPSIVITNERAFVRAVATPLQYAGLHNGKIADIRGRANILVDHLEVRIDCDSASISARFVRIVEPPKLASNTPNSDVGCG